MPRNLSLTFVLALCTMMGALGIDTYLPSFHAIAQEFAVGPAAVQQTLSVYVYNKATALNLGYASAMSLVLTLLLCCVSVPYLKQMLAKQ